MVTMKPFAVRSFGLSMSLLTLIQLPAFASNQAPDTSLNSRLSTHINTHTLAGASEQPKLLAVALTVRSLRQGDQGADVRALQRYLSRDGLYPFVIDGFYGQETANAVSTYQRIRDLPATGIADEQTLTDMEFDFLPVSRGTSTGIPQPPSATGSLGAGSLGPGSTGTDVIALQQQLNDFGLPVAVDGVYGFETQQAVRTYQRVQGLNPTGTADRDTLRTMGFSASGRISENRYVAAVIADSSELGAVRTFFEDAFVDSDRRGSFINLGSFSERYPAEARADAARARGFRTRVLYR